MTTADDEQWDDPTGLETDDESDPDLSAAGVIAGVITTATLLYFLWIGAHTEAVLTLWAIIALAAVRMLVTGLRGAR